MKNKAIIILLSTFLIVLSSYFIKQTYSMDETSDNYIVNNINKLNTILETNYDTHNKFSLTSIVDENGKPPAYSYYTHIKSRGIKELKAYDDKIFMGLGDWTDNTGPAKILYYDTLTNKVVSSGTIKDEAVENFNIIDNKLYTTGTDPRTSLWDFGSYYVYNKENNNWEQHEFQMGWIHVFEIIDYNGKLFMGGATNDSKKKTPIQVSYDNGNTFENITIKKDGEILPFHSYIRFYAFVKFKGELYAYTYSDYYGLYKYDEEKNEFNFLRQLGSSDSQYGVPESVRYNVVHFRNNTVFNDYFIYITGGKYAYKTLDMINYEKLPITTTDVVQDVVVVDDTLYTLSYQYNSDKTFSTRIYRTKDLATFDLVYEFNIDTLPFSIEHHNNQLYIGTIWDENSKDYNDYNTGVKPTSETETGSLYKIDLNTLKTQLELDKKNKVINITKNKITFPVNYTLNSDNSVFTTTLTFDDSMSKNEWESEFNKLENMNLLYLLCSNEDNINYNSAILYYNNILNSNIAYSSEYNSATELYNDIFANDLNIKSKRFSIISEDISDTEGEYKILIKLTVNYIDDRITSEKYKINYEKNYIYIGEDNDINVIKNNILYSDIFSIDIDLDNNKLLLQQEDEIIREYLIIRVISDTQIINKTIFTGSLNDTDITSKIKISHGKASVTADAILQVKYEDIVIDEYLLIRISFSDLYLIDDKKIYVSNKTSNDVKNSFYITNSEFSIDDNKIKVTINEKDIAEINLLFIKTGKLQVKNKSIFIPKSISYNDFISNINVSDEISFKIMKNNTEITEGNIEAQMKLKVYHDGKEIDSFDLINEYISFNTSINIDTENQILDNISSNKNASYLINKINTSGKIVVMNNKGETLNNNDYIGTGSKVSIHFYDNISQYSMMIKGDINGDGILSLEDINRIANYLYKDKNSLSDVYLNAADYDNNNLYNLEDIMKIAYKMKEKDNYDNLASKIANLYKNSEETIDTTVGDVVYKLDTNNNLMSDVAGNIRYYGPNPNNYIYFNCDVYPDTNCEVWRIVGVFDGKVKIVRNESIGRLSYDFDGNNDILSVTYNNKWTGSSINKLLNSAYLNNYDTKYYNYDFNNQEIIEHILNFATNKNGIKGNTIDFISEAQYNVGGWYFDNRDMYADDIYKYEQGFDTYDDINYQSKWTGKVAISNVSDYIYATDLTKCQETFYNYKLKCSNENWLKNILTVDYAGWSINHISIHDEPAYVFYQVTGGFANSRVTSPMYVNPVVQLNSYTNISLNGNGTYENPYRIILD